MGRSLLLLWKDAQKGRTVSWISANFKTSLLQYHIFLMLRSFYSVIWRPGKIAIAKINPSIEFHSPAPSFSEGVWRCTHAKNWPHRHRTPARDRLPRPALGQEWTLWAGNLSASVSPLLTRWCVWCDYTLPFGSVAVALLAAKLAWCWCLSAWIIFFHSWVAYGKYGGGVVPGIRCWVAAAIGRLCLFCKNPILWRIVVKATNATPGLILWCSVAWLGPNCPM